VKAIKIFKLNLNASLKRKRNTKRKRKILSLYKLFQILAKTLSNYLKIVRIKYLNKQKSNLRWSGIISIKLREVYSVKILLLIH